MPDFIKSIQRKQIVVIVLLILCALLLLISDVAQPFAYEDMAFLTPIPQETFRAYNLQTPISNKLQAAIAGMQVGGVMQWVITPIVRSVDHISLAEAKTRVAVSGYQSEDWPWDTKVWLVVLQGNAQVFTPPSFPEYETMTPTPTILHGCFYVILDAQNPDNRLQEGSITCPFK